MRCLVLKNDVEEEGGGRRRKEEEEGGGGRRTRKDAERGGKRRQEAEEESRKHLRNWHVSALTSCGRTGFVGEAWEQTSREDHLGDAR